MMNDRGKSDRSVVPEKLPNKADHHAAEVVEERDRAKGNCNAPRSCLLKRDGFLRLSVGECLGVREKLAAGM